MIISKLSAITLIALLITTVAVPQAFAQERRGDTYTASSSINTQSDPFACGTTTSPTQCAVLDAAVDPIPPYVAQVLSDQGGVVLNPQSCDIILISSGNPLDQDMNLNTQMNTPGCGPNPDNFPTFDCVDVTVTPPVDALVLAWSAEWPEFVASSFTDWDRIGGVVSVSINDWAGADLTPNTPDDIPSLVQNNVFGPSSIGSVTEGNIAAGVTIDLRVADSGDMNLDTGKIVIPVSCLEDPKTSFLCGNGTLEPGETCDDGNNANGDGCSSVCTLENGEPPKSTPVGGEFVSIDSTALLIAGMSANMGLLAPIVAGIAGAGAYYIKTRMSKE